MRKIFCIAVSVIFLTASSAAFGKDFWKEKKFEKWSKKECNKMLSDSPWSQDYTLQKSDVFSAARATDNSQPLYIKYLVQIRSALPVRQAIVRQMQIAQNYDKLAPEQKQQFDQSAEKFLSTNFTDAVILYVTYETNSQSNDRELARYWQSRTMDLLKNYVFLRNSRGDQVALAQFGASQGGERSFQLIFPRQINGQPLIGPEDKSLQLEFTYPATGSQSEGTEFKEGTAYIEFKPKNMVFEGNLTY
jgi:hypothetical protein